MIRLGDVAWVAAQFLGERQGAVHLSIGAVGRSDDGIDAVAPGHLGERRGEQRRDGGERVGHGRPFWPDHGGSHRI